MTKVTIFDTELQNNIATLLLAGHDPNDIATKLGCRNPVVYTLKNSEKYAKLAYDSAIMRLISEGSPAAVEALIDVATDKKAPKQARVSAADKLLHHTGCILNEKGQLERAPGQMTQAEIHQRLQELQNEAARRAQNVTIEGSATNVSRETLNETGKLDDLLG